MYQALIQGCESCRARSGPSYPNQDRSRAGITGSVQGYQPYEYDNRHLSARCIRFGKSFPAMQTQITSSRPLPDEGPEIDCVPRSGSAESSSEVFQEKACNCGGMKSWWLW